MSMKINGSYNHSTAKYVEEAMRNKEEAGSAGAAKATDGVGGPAKVADGVEGPAKAADGVKAPHDEYISSEKEGARPSGLYRVGQDEDGSRKIFYDDPRKAGKADEKKEPKVNGENPKDSEEEWVGNTDKVEREIRELKEKKRQIEQQLRAASGDEEKTEELEQKLTQVENELRQKDNDTYRRQNAKVTPKK